MAHMRKGQLAAAQQWWKHLRKEWRRRFWKRERAAERDTLTAEIHRAVQYRYDYPLTDRRPCCPVCGGCHHR